MSDHYKNTSLYFPYDDYVSIAKICAFAIDRDFTRIQGGRIRDQFALIFTLLINCKTPLKEGELDWCYFKAAQIYQQVRPNLSFNDPSMKAALPILIKIKESLID